MNPDPDRPRSVAFAPGLAVWAVLGCAALVSARIVSELLKHQVLGIDFLAMWTGGALAGGHPGQLYDFAAVTRAQAWLLGEGGRQRPFPYPPSALLIFAPLSRLPFWWANFVWLFATLGAFAAAGVRRAMPARGLVLVLIFVSPTLAWAAASGQTTFLVGALAIWALSDLQTRPIAAGALLGIAAAIKPSLLVMAPLALAAGGHGRALLGAAASGAAMGALALAIWGVGPWLDWLAALPRFVAEIQGDPAFQATLVGPAGLASRLGVDGAALGAVRLSSILVGAALGVLAFWRSADAPTRLAGLVGGGLLATPYAMNYDAAILVPGAAAALAANLAGPGRLKGLIGFGGLIVAAVPGVCPAGLLVHLGVALGPTVAGAVAAARRRLVRRQVAAV